MRTFTLATTAVVSGAPPGTAVVVCGAQFRSCPASSSNPYSAVNRTWRPTQGSEPSYG